MNSFRMSAVLVVLALLVPMGASAQIATPDTTLDAPPPALCTIAPRTASGIEALIASMDGTETPVISLETPNPDAATPTPFAAPLGSPVSSDVGREIAEVVTMFYACQNANDTLRAYALLTDAYLVRTIQVGRIGPQQLAEMMTPKPPRLRTNLLSMAINGMTEIKSDAYGVNVIGTFGHSGDGFAEYLIVVREGDNLRIDDEVFLSN